MAFVPLTKLPSRPVGSERWYLVREGEVLTSGPGRLPAGVPGGLASACDTDRVLLGTDGDEVCWAVGVAADTPEPDGCRWEPLRALARSVSLPDWNVAGRAVQLVEWARSSRYCGRCATPTEAMPADRARRCPACGLLAYPRLAPAVIVLIRRGREALLGRNARFPGAMFSTLAGFVEAGETIEEAVHREIGEEVGVRVTNLRYFGSQPWPFPHSLMLGFVADWEGGEIEIDPEEIAEAAWFTPESLPEIPPGISIARRMIDAWLAEAADDHEGRSAGP